MSRTKARVCPPTLDFVRDILQMVKSTKNESLVEYPKKLNICWPPGGLQGSNWAPKMEPKSLKNPSKTTFGGVLEALPVKSRFFEDVPSKSTTFAPGKEAQTDPKSSQTVPKPIPKEVPKRKRK